MNLGENDMQRATRREIITGLTFGLSAVALVGVIVPAEAAEEIAHDMESIHQEVVFKASPARLYAALTDENEFQKVVLLSDAVKTGMVKAAKPAQISTSAGGEFSAFGGYITGRQIELVPNVRIVQAWRAGSWDPGTYSIARFQLAARGAGTSLTFDHTGFPKGEAQHLAQGWTSNYWQPLNRLLM